MTQLSLGLTPCPNDTFLLGALVHGLIDLHGLRFATELKDIERLNCEALAGRYDICKVSCAVYGELAKDYALLDTGAALADGYGPLVLARRDLTPAELAAARVVAPGEHTSGALLFRQWAPATTTLAFHSYTEIAARVADGEFDAGVVIHEARFTYGALDLRCLVDLGAWWKATHGLAVPLGCYVMRRSLYERHGAMVETLMRQSLARAEQGDAVIDAYVRRHAQESSDDVIRRHIALYVTAATRSMGAAGRHAIDALLGLGEAAA